MQTDQRSTGDGTGDGPDSAARRRLKIAYLCDADPADPFLYSGGNARIYQALATQFDDITVLPQDWGLAEPLRQLVLRLPEPIILRGKWRLHLLLSRIIARRLRRRLLQGGYDVVFGAYSFHSLHNLQLPEGMVSVYTSDATPTIYKRSEVGQSFESYLKASRLFDRFVEGAERAVFSRLDLLLWPSDWMRRSAAELYDLSPEANLTVPWGANVPDPGVAPGPQLARDKPVQILLVGRDWWAKGGPITAQAVALLRARGIDARLTVVGCTPPDTGLGAAIRVFPSLDKSQPEELAQFTALYRDAHFLMMPSFESYGFAFCEASAFGLPALCLDVGGVPVWDGVNGRPLPPGSTAADFADVVSFYMADPERYQRLRQDTRAEYEARLNWQAWAQKTASLIDEAVSKKSR